MLRALVVSLGLSLALLIPQQAPSSIMIVNARIYTGNPAQPWAEAVRIEGNRVARVGSSAEVRALGTAGRTIDAGGRLLIPGVNDAHDHPAVDPPGATALDGPPVAEHEPTLDEVLVRVKSAIVSAPKGGWITGEVDDRAGHARGRRAAVAGHLQGPAARAAEDHARADDHERADRARRLGKVNIA